MDMENRANVENAGDNGNRRTMAQRLEDNAPYNLFFSTIPMSSDTLQQKNSITFKDLLCPSLGNLKLSLQITFVVDVHWLLEQYFEMGQAKPLFVLHGKKINYECRQLPCFLNEIHVDTKNRYSTHHSKIGLYVYEDNSLRVVVSTANLVPEDWNYYCQGLWISPLCRQLPEDAPNSSGESPTGFKYSLFSYLQQYNLSESSHFLQYVQRADFSAIRVFLVTSAPGTYEPTIPNHCHLFSVRHLLSTYCSLPPTDDISSWRINAQGSSFGTLGPTPEYWLRGIFLQSLASNTKEPFSRNSNATLNVIYPSQANVLNNYFGPIGAKCLYFSQENRNKQQWLKRYLHSWKADNLSRSRAMPHIKTYCRISPCETKLAWFLLTSANTTQAAWGGKISYDDTSRVLSYEVGVMFLPQFFGQDYFKIKSDRPEENVFPFIYDLPLTPYREDDELWISPPLE